MVQRGGIAVPHCRLEALGVAVLGRCDDGMARVVPRTLSWPAEAAARLSGSEASERRLTRVASTDASRLCGSAGHAAALRTDTVHSR